MAALTLYIHEKPIAEITFIPPSYDNALTREANYMKNRTIIRAFIDVLKSKHLGSIIDAESNYYIVFSLGSSMNKPAAKHESNLILRRRGRT